MDGERLDPGVFDLPVDRLRAGYYSDTYFNLTKELLERERMNPRVLDAGLSEARVDAGRHRRGHRGRQARRRPLRLRRRLAARLGFARRRGPARGRPDRAVRDRDDDRRRLLDVRPPRNGLSRLSVAAIAGHAQRPSGVHAARGQADPCSSRPGTIIGSCRPGTAGRLTSPGRSGFDRRRRLVVGRPRGRDGPPRHDRSVRRRHRRGSARLRPRVRRAAERDGAGRLRQRLGGNGGRRADALGNDLWGIRLDTSRHWWTPGSPGWIRTLPRACPWSSPSSFAGHSTMPDTSESRSSSRAGSTPNGSRPSRPPAHPVDSYGVGSALLTGSNDFTADIVRLDGRPIAKAGREERPNPRLLRVD